MIYVALLLFFVSDYLRPTQFVPALGVLRLNAAIPLTFILGTMFGRPPRSNTDFAAETSSRLIGALLVLMIVSTLFARVTMSAYDVTKNVFAYMLVYWVIVRQVGDLRRLKGIFVTLALVHVAIAALSPELFATTDGRAGINSGAFLGDGNDFALSINICIPLCLFLVAESRRKLERLAWVLVLLGLVLTVVATKSRGGTLALGAIAFYYWLKSDRKVLMASVAAVTLAVVLVSAPPLYFERMSTMADTEESSAQGRLKAWSAGIGMAAGSPIVGVGPGHFPMYYGNANASRWMTAHSIYFLVLGELGLPGLVILLLLIGSNLWANRRLREDLACLDGPEGRTASNLLSSTSASLLGFAIGGAFLSAAYYPHLYVLSGLLVAGRHVVRRQLAIAAKSRAAISLPDAAAIAPRVSVPGRISAEWRPRMVEPGSHAGVSGRRVHARQG